jgi:hypothetical protein
LSGSVELVIVTGSDWATQIFWQDQFSNGVPFTNPVMEIRQDLNPASVRLARLDTSGTADGLIDITATGTMLLTLPAAVTANLTTGTAFWDLFLTTGFNQRARLLFGSVAIKPHVTTA